LNAVVRLTKPFSPDQYARGLESWSWIGIEGKTPVVASLFGDVFLVDPDGYWFLDSMEGSLALVWHSKESLEAALGAEEGQDKYLLAGLAHAAQREGIDLKVDEVYDLAPPPILGGPFDVKNIVAADFAVALNIAGQIHEQVQGLPPGTNISGLSIDHLDRLSSPPGSPAGSSDSRHRRRFRRSR
jgi:hypothetical protein